MSFNIMYTLWSKLSVASQVRKSVDVIFNCLKPLYSTTLDPRYDPLPQLMKSDFCEDSAAKCLGTLCCTNAHTQCIINLLIK